MIARYSIGGYKFTPTETAAIADIILKAAEASVDNEQVEVQIRWYDEGGSPQYTEQFIDKRILDMPAHKAVKQKCFDSQWDLSAVHFPNNRVLWCSFCDKDKAHWTNEDDLSKVHPGLFTGAQIKQNLAEKRKANEKRKAIEEAKAAKEATKDNRHYAQNGDSIAKIREVIRAMKDGTVLSNKEYFITGLQGVIDNIVISDEEEFDLMNEVSK